MAIQNKKTTQKKSAVPIKWIITAGVVIAVLAAGAGAYYYFKPGEPNPAKMSGDQIMTYMQSQDFNSLPGEQRHAFFEKVMDSRIAGYFKAPPDQRDAYLDKILDDMQKMRANFQRRGPRDPNRMRQMQQSYSKATPEQKRLRNETRDPVKSAMRRQFFAALGARAASRGVQMGGFGGGGGRGR